jgi:glycosyltransferase involved in cell wall biosynthesis
VKPLSQRQKQWAEAYLVRGPLRAVARPAFRALLGAQVAAASLLSRRPEPVDASAITAVIKTFERPRACARLVRSLQRLYPAMPILVVDDSRDPRPIAGTRLIALPFDSGVGAGRQAGLEQVRTPFVLNLDDDFLLYGGANLGMALDALRQHPQLDLLGGRVIDLPLFITHDFRRASLFPTQAAPKVSPGTRFGAVEVLDKVPNFFLARTDAVRAVGWNPALKRLDHADFFTRAKGRIVSGLLETFRVLHLRDPFDTAYRAFRDDLAADLTYLRATYPGAR